MVSSPTPHAAAAVSTCDFTLPSRPNGESSCDVADPCTAPLVVTVLPMTTSMEIPTSTLSALSCSARS